LDAAVESLRAAGVSAAGLAGDVRSPAAAADWVAATVSMFGSLSILVNCAAGNFLANAAELSQGGFRAGEVGEAVQRGCGVPVRGLATEDGRIA
jgi:peroxisomal 2,4-dienoyl-CoA reductase